MTKEELLQKLAEFEQEDLSVALKAAQAAKRARTEGFYFLHYFFEEERIEESVGQSLVTIPVTELVMNPAKMLHGGVTAFICDNVMGMASYMEKGRSGVTLDLSVRYHKPGKGARLIARGEVVSAGSRINSARCEVRDEQGSLIATATGSFYHR
ncbi:PaaI family thioesterase [Polycladomyces subterraneus]|uniref:Medium/long-chain acyl-CoA thioesterase YigI n=1 Tax=Polycladomyces subterraneus TaxID=1016997 RepID=A0ABT8IQX0_9BACL|nr:PaaI family thioesterase [Polycladomyces subterraneus]MDN4595167.1 PaaI family thioesterase [Polycladomyces subterraneus]